LYLTAKCIKSGLTLFKIWFFNYNWSSFYYGMFLEPSYSLSLKPH